MKISGSSDPCRVTVDEPKPRIAFVNTPDLLAFDDALLCEVGEVLSITPADAPVNGPEPDVPRLVFENAADGVVRQMSDRRITSGAVLARDRWLDT
jgi:hypothetical protein